MNKLYSGHNINYWLGLERRSKKLDTVNWIDETSDLISFYEGSLTI